MEVQSEVRERPILFSGPMVRAILDGKKTQTRRVVKNLGVYVDTEMSMGGPQFDGDCWVWPDGTCGTCSYGKPGDRLWVRETWQHPEPGPVEPGGVIVYREDYADHPHGYDGEKSPEGKYRTWRPSIFMPRLASRITLEITDIRVHRLQEISEEDAIAEGAQFAGFPASLTNRGAFAKLWEKINGKRGQCKTCKGHGVLPAWSGSVNGGSLAQDSKDCPDCKGDDRGFGWDANPWVWSISFQRVN